MSGIIPLLPHIPSRRGQGQPNWLMGVVFNCVKDLAFLGLFQKLAVYLIAEQQIWELCFKNVLDRTIYQVSLRDFKFSL